jgi:hypothetical protein
MSPSLAAAAAAAAEISKLCQKKLIDLLLKALKMGIT